MSAVSWSFASAATSIAWRAIRPKDASDVRDRVHVLLAAAARWVLVERTALGDLAGGPVSDPAELHHALRDEIHAIVDVLDDVVLQLVERDELGSPHVPVRDLELRAKVDRVGE